MACHAGWLGRSIGVALMLLTLQEGGGRSITAAKAADVSRSHTALSQPSPQTLAQTTGDPNA
ncbi:MAG TPA: hypothetical protein V6C50_01590, partial [Crinalium sp.]